MLMYLEVSKIIKVQNKYSPTYCQLINCELIIKKCQTNEPMLQLDGQLLQCE